MDIVISATLSYEGIAIGLDPPKFVDVYLGQQFLAQIPAVSQSKAGDGDDSTYFRKEDERVVEESVAAWVQPLLELIETQRLIGENDE